MTPPFRPKQAKRSSVRDGEISATGAGGAEDGTGLTLEPFAILEVQMWQTHEREHDTTPQCPEQRPGGPGKLLDVAHARTLCPFYSASLFLKNCLTLERFAGIKLRWCSRSSALRESNSEGRAIWRSKVVF